MSSKIENIIKGFTDSIKTASSKKTSPYDTSATVTRVDGNTCWVHIPGGVDETPARLTMNASVGDNVQVRVSGGKAFLIGNTTAPPTDDTTARVAKVTAEKAYDKSYSASEEASVAARAAESAIDSAIAANAAANGAVTSLGIVQGVVDTLQTDVDELNVHVAMMNEITIPDFDIYSLVDEDGNALIDDDENPIVAAIKKSDPSAVIPAGLHVVPTSNGYFLVLSNNGAYIYDNLSNLVASYGNAITLGGPTGPQIIIDSNGTTIKQNSKTRAKFEQNALSFYKEDGTTKNFSINESSTVIEKIVWEVSGIQFDEVSTYQYISAPGIDSITRTNVEFKVRFSDGSSLGVFGVVLYGENQNYFSTSTDNGNLLFYFSRSGDTITYTFANDTTLDISSLVVNIQLSYTTSNPISQVLLGRFPRRTSDTALAVGNGTSNIPKNVFEVDISGDVFSQGEILVEGHEEAIGTLKESITTSDTTVPDGTSTTTNLCSISLGSGSWVISYQARFANNSTGFRQLRLINNTTGDEYTEGMVQMGASSTGYTYVQGTTLVRLAGTTSYTLTAKQTSGSSMIIPAGKAFLKAMRVS